MTEILHKSKHKTAKILHKSKHHAFSAAAFSSSNSSSVFGKYRFWKISINATPTVTAESAMLKMGEKKVKWLPPTKGIQSGQLASMIGK
jgi:hypothetical protein